MKKSINIGIILFLLLQACSGTENIENQASVEPISENTPINPPPGENNPPPTPGVIMTTKFIKIIHLHRQEKIIHHHRHQKND